MATLTTTYTRSTNTASTAVTIIINTITKRRISTSRILARFSNSIGISTKLAEAKTRRRKVVLSRPQKGKGNFHCLVKDGLLI